MFENTIEKGIFNLYVNSVSYDFKNLLIPFTCKRKSRGTNNNIISSNSLILTSGFKKQFVRVEVSNANSLGVPDLYDKDVFIAILSLYDKQKKALERTTLNTFDYNKIRNITITDVAKEMGYISNLNSTVRSNIYNSIARLANTTWTLSYYEYSTTINSISNLLYKTKYTLIKSYTEPTSSSNIIYITLLLDNIACKELDIKNILTYSARQYKDINSDHAQHIYSYLISRKKSKFTFSLDELYGYFPKIPTNSQIKNRTYIKHRKSETKSAIDTINNSGLAYITFIKSNTLLFTKNKN